MRPGMIGGLALVLAVVVSACGSPFVEMLANGSPHPHQAQLDELGRNAERWAASGITRYAFTYRPSCFCDTTPHLVVVDGGTTRIDGSPVDPSQPLHDWIPAGVPGLFALVRQAIDGDEVSTTYDPATGVPTAMDSDPMQNAIDDELAFTITDWTLDPPDDSVLGRVSAARTQWIRQGIGSYTMTIRIACSCAYDGKSFTATNRDGRVDVTSDGRSIDLDRLEGVPYTVDQLFRFAADFAPNGRTSVELDPELAYPRRIEVGPDPTVAGQDETIEVLRFTVP